MAPLPDALARDPLAFALALPLLPHVGRVTAGRVLDRFATLAALRATPREQVLHRLAGTPRLDALVATLHDDEAMAFALQNARAEADALARKRVAVLAPNVDGWPAGLARLDRSDRPALLHVFGDPGALGAPLVAFFGANGLDVDAFEYAQALATAVVQAGGVVVAGLANGFDVVLHRVATRHGGRSVAVLGCGIGRLAPPMRPVAMEVGRAGGALVSAFGFDHGPFDHDDKERALAMATLARTAAFFDPAPGTADARALEKARTPENGVGLGLDVYAFGPRAPVDAPRLTGDVARDLPLLLPSGPSR